MAKITRIKAKDPGKSPEEAVKDSQTIRKVKVGKDSGKSAKPAKTASKVAKNAAEVDSRAEKADKKAEKAAKKAAKAARKAEKGQKESKNYFKNAWMELRQVRWPSRKATWKMVLAIFVYTAIFITIIMLLDALFTWLFGLILG